MEMRDEVLSSVGAQDWDTSSFQVANPIVLDEEEDKENSPPPTTPESVRPTEPYRLQRSRAFGAILENVPDYVYRNLFPNVLPRLCFDIFCN